MATAEFYERTTERRQEQVQRQAEANGRRAGLHEKNIEFVGAGDINVDPSKMAQLSGTGTAWDQQYFVNAVTFVFDQPDGAAESGGCTMTIEASNMDGSRADASPGPLPSILGAVDTFGATPGQLDAPDILSPSPTPGAPNGFVK